MLVVVEVSRTEIVSVRTTLSGTRNSELQPLEPLLGCRLKAMVCESGWVEWMIHLSSTRLITLGLEFRIPGMEGMISSSEAGTWSGAY